MSELYGQLWFNTFARPSKVREIGFLGSKIANALYSYKNFLASLRACLFLFYRQQHESKLTLN